MRAYPRRRGSVSGLSLAVALALSGVTAIRAQDATRPDYIDEQLEAAWEEAGVKPSPICTDAEFLRRAYLDILGRIPNVEEARSFLASQDPGRREKLVNYLLEHPDYPKYFGNEFSILLIGRRTQDRDVDRAALQSWLRKQFAADRPWKQIAFELITATGSNKENGAVNYTLAHLGDNAVNLTSFSTRVFLGQQIQCTQCHDHPSNDWKQKDFWGINAFFRGTRKREVRRIDASGAEVTDHVELLDEPTDEWAYFEDRKAIEGTAPPTYLDGRRISPGMDVPNRREALGKMIAAADNEQFARAFVNRIWGHFMGRGFVHPVDDFGDHNVPSHPELLDRLTADFMANDYNVKDLIRWVTSSKAYHVSSRMTPDNDKDDVLYSHFLVRPMEPEQLFDSLITATSAHKTAGDAPERQRQSWLDQFVVTFANDEAGETSNFSGTIPQSLMMMNGDLMARATGGGAGSFLRHVFDEAQLQRKVSPVRYCVDQIYLAALSRAPSSAELKRASAFLGSGPDTVQILEDLFWALLNSNEFVLIH
jgi:hypothetical protein